MPADYSRDIFYRTKRALAIGGNKLIVPTTDMHLIALDVKTGEVVWDVVTDDSRKTKRVYNGGPLVVNGQGHHGRQRLRAGRSSSCFITGHDLETGKELWRFNTIAQPGEPGGDTWNNVPPEKRWGASVWMPPSYDPELNLVCIAAPARRSRGRRSTAAPTTRRAAARTATASTRTPRWRSIPTPASWSGTTSTCRTTRSIRTTPSSGSSCRSSGGPASARR